MYDPKDLRALSRLLADMQRQDKDRTLTGDDLTLHRLLLQCYKADVDKCLKIFIKTFEE